MNLRSLLGITGGTARANSAVVLDANKAIDVLTVGTLTVTGATVPAFAVASGDGAITAKSGVVFITKGSAAALTIADPTATTDDGKRLTVISTTAFAHTVSNAAGSGFNAGGAATDVGTYGGAKGDNFEFVAYQGKWYAVSLRNVTLG